MLQGSAKIFLGDDTYHTQSGDCVIFAPGSLYHAEISSRENCRFISINFNVQDSSQQAVLGNLLGLRDIAIFPALVPEHTQDYLYTILERVVQEKPDSYYSSLLLLKRLVGLMVYHGRHVSRSELHHRITTAQEQLVLGCHQYIINNPHICVTVDMLCRQFNVSQSYLYKCFKGVLGVSSKQFITNAQLDLAAKELIHSDKPIAQIAHEHGYANSFGFSSLFRKNYGVSPSEYRKQNR